MKHRIILIVLFQFILGHSFATKFTVISRANHPTIAFSMSELKLFLNQKNGFTYTQNAADVEWIIMLKSNPSLPESGFAVECYTKNNRQYIELTGATERDIPCAVYTFLEKLGYTFDVDGYSLNEKINPKVINNYAENVIPLTKFRGIRQHINFPMDISSYSLPDAKQYILNLARMRFNFITFHSYPGQWYELKKNGLSTSSYAGNFFYGDRHDIPDNTLIKEHIANKKTFSIPEVEPYYDNIPKRSQMAVEWLNGVMNEAKRAGMKLQFSFEPRDRSTSVSQTVDAVRQISAQYPQVDVIELITEEAGGWGPQNTDEETKKILTSFFGNGVLADTILTAPIKQVQSDLGYIYAQIGHIIKTIDTVKKLGIKLPPLKLGIYCTNDYNRAAYHLARKFLPNAEICILPAHGSANVAKNIPKVLTETDWGNSIIYSWLEFDGMMYLQQNGIKGIYELILNRTASKPLERLNTIAFNHWRTSENKITARYAAISTLYGAEAPALFYKKYATKVGIAQPEAFSDAMGLLQKAFDTHTSNLGFAWMGYWKNGFKFDASPRVSEMLELYENTRMALNKCATGNANDHAKNTVQLLDNRLHASILYLKAYVMANRLNEPNISNEKYNQVCNEVLSVFNDCLKVYAEMLPDRGCEGTLINMYLSPVRGIKISRQKKTGVPLDEPLQPVSHFDQPAPPIFKGGN